MSDRDPFELSTSFVHLGLGATSVPQPPFDGMEWYERYGERHGSDGAEGRLVSMYTFTESWPSWEVHPNGEEVVICTAGTMTLHQEHADGTTAVAVLEAGQAIVNPRGTWHTADIEGSATAVFVTAGLGTLHRDR